MTSKSLSMKNIMPSTSYIAVISVLLGVVVLYIYMYSVENFADENTIEVMLFYADWCGHCKKFKPTWEEAKRVMKQNKNGVPVKMTSINADENKADVKKYNVSGFPTIKAKYAGKVHEFNGERTLEGLKSFVDGL